MGSYQVGGQPAVQTNIDTSQFSDLEVLDMVFMVMREDIRTAIVYEVGKGGSIQAGPLLHEGVLYVAACDCNLYALDAQTGMELWRFTAAGPNWGMPAVWKESILFASFDHGLYALDFDGRLKWKMDLQEMAYAVTVANGNAYVGTKAGVFFCIDAESGRVRWRFATQGPIKGYAAVSDGLIVFGSDDGILYALDKDGREVWRFAARGPIAQRPVIRDGMVYVGGLDHCFYALTTEGALRWVFRGSQGAISIGEPVITDEAVVFGSRDGILYCLSRADGALQWKFTTQGIVTTRPVVHEGRVYFGSDDTNFYAITVAGELVWKFKVNGLLDSWPVLEKGVLYFGSYDCHMYAVEAASGALRWKFATSIGTPSPVDFTPFKKKEPAVTVTWRSQDIGQTEKKYREQGGPLVTGGSAYATKSQYIERSQYAAGSKSRYAR